MRFGTTTWTCVLHVRRQGGLAHVYEVELLACPRASTAVISCSMCPRSSDTHARAEEARRCRALLGGMVLAIKFLDDDLCTNAHYARAGGVAPSVLRELEASTFSALEGRLRVSPAEVLAVLDKVRPPCVTNGVRAMRRQPVYTRLVVRGGCSATYLA